jgi:hypothetical protein
MEAHNFKFIEIEEDKKLDEVYHDFITITTIR